jgi:hypothetical protein
VFAGIEFQPPLECAYRHCFIPCPAKGRYLRYIA